MREEYSIKDLNPRKNPYASRLRRQVTINLDNAAVDYFKEQSEEVGLPYQTLINLYLADCASKRRKLQLSWS